MCGILSINRQLIWLLFIDIVPFHNGVISLPTLGLLVYVYFWTFWEFTYKMSRFAVNIHKSWWRFVGIKPSECNETHSLQTLKRTNTPRERWTVCTKRNVFLPCNKKKNASKPPRVKITDYQLWPMSHDSLQLSIKSTYIVSFWLTSGSVLMSIQVNFWGVNKNWSWAPKLIVLKRFFSQAQILLK